MTPPRRFRMSGFDTGAARSSLRLLARFDRPTAADAAARYPPTQWPARSSPRCEWSASCGRRATRSSSASTRWAGARGPGPISVGAAVLPQDKRVYKVRDSKMLTEKRARAPLRPHRGVVRGLGRRATPPRSSATPSACRPPRSWRPSGPSTASALTPDKVLIDGNWDFVGARQHPAARQGRRPLPVDRRRVDPGQGHPRPHHAGGGRRTSPATTSTSTRATRAPATRWRCKAWGPTSIHRRTWVFMDHLPLEHAQAARADRRS